MDVENAKNTVIVYHQQQAGVDCPDGICSAWVVSKAIGSKDYQLLGDSYLNNGDYNEQYSLPFVLTGRRVILVDFSYPRHIMQHICNLAREVVVLDHHKSRGEFLLSMRLEDQIKGGFDINECGSTFAWKYFSCDIKKPGFFPKGLWQRVSMLSLKLFGRGFIDAPPWFLSYVRQRDIGADGYYDGAIPESEAIGIAMSRRRGKAGVGSETFKFFDELCEASEEELINEGFPDIKKRDEAIQDFLKEWETNPEMMQVADWQVPALKCPEHLHKDYSMVGSAGARRWQQYPFVAVITNDATKISLRSRSGGMDVSEIAKSLGGGGHENAAGYSLN